jgi:tetratricopeptide (TPR) repeat protein
MATERRLSSAATICSSGLVLLLLAGPARAQGDADARARAGALVDEGVALFHKGDAAAALDRFEQARQLYPSPKIDFDIAEALRALGRTAEAAEAYDRFLEETGGDSREVASQRRTARSELDRLERGLARIALEIEPDDPAREVRLDGLVTTVRPGRPLYVAPGRHVVDVTAPGYRPVRTEVAVSAGELRDLAVALGSEAAAMPPVPAEHRNDELMVERPAPAPHRRRVWTWVAASAAAGLLAGGVFFGRRADSAWDEYQTTGSPGRYDQLHDQIRRDSLTANLLFAGSGVAAIGSVLLFVGEF